MTERVPTKELHVEFSVDYRDRQATTTIVRGRCCRGVVRVGAIFRRAFRIDGGGEFLQLNAAVLRISAYSQELSEIDTGLTAELVLSAVLPNEIVDDSTWLLAA